MFFVEKEKRTDRPFVRGFNLEMTPEGFSAPEEQALPPDAAMPAISRLINSISLPRYSGIWKSFEKNRSELYQIIHINKLDLSSVII